MATESVSGGLDPISAVALVGVLGVGAQWLAWRLRMPAIVLMLVAGVIVGPVLGIFDPARDIGPFYKPMISIAVAIILFEGGLTLNFHSLRDAATGVKRLVYVGAPLGWLLSTLALHYAAGLSWETSAVFGGLMIVTGPTVIAPLLRTARLSKRPSALLQWEAIVNDPFGALAAVLAMQVVYVVHTSEGVAAAATHLVIGIIAALVLGIAAGALVAWAFSRGKVPEYMKVPVLFVLVLGCFAISNKILHESGLLAVTVMGMVIANADLPSFAELRRFKEHATLLLVSGVFILLAAGLDVSALGNLSWRAAFFIIVVVLLVRPLTVLLSLMGTDIPKNEKILVATTGPRGVVLISVAGLFASALMDAGVEDGNLLNPLAFVLVAATVVIHGFTLAPVARYLGVTAARRPGVILVGGSDWTTSLAETLKKAEIPVLIADDNRAHLRKARDAGIETFYGDILSEEAELTLDMNAYKIVVAATDNDAYNTLVAGEMAPEFGREHVFQVARDVSDTRRKNLPPTIGGQEVMPDATYSKLNKLIWKGWTFRITNIGEEYTMEAWRQDRPDAVLMGYLDEDGEIHPVEDDDGVPSGKGTRVLAMVPEGQGGRNGAKNGGQPGNVDA
ncbi:cation:proton antiporter [Palleronia caenipelagi]|uniref:Sodium:proton antiporter n=1 Tax=Palleronia caenipelagi TaxID=2489174 RepID=A0A547PXL4_9RHOB|nr:sodium:proton antiporter [Palleronia caenipelagi]TRD18885.1 sodium:proton antiporter [Palleronia caenipelagi]